MLANILNSINQSFANLKPARIIMEPGRLLVADAGILETEVILAQKRNQNNKKR